MKKPNANANANVDTIVARASAAGVAGVAVIRVSGPLCQQIAKSILGFIPKPRYASLATFKSASAQIIDQGIAIYFPAPNSFTGEDCLELQGHGGLLVSNAVIAACIEAGARQARPGEFTQRAYLHGKIDLAQSEAVLDLIHAQTDLAAQGAAQSLCGAFSAAISDFRENLIRLRMWVEAHLDFVEEEIPQQDSAAWQLKLDSCTAELKQLLAKTEMSAKLNIGAKLVLVGRPNAGKSSLLNALVGHSKAIVTDVPGTTRDLISANIIIDGLPVEIIDTAGLTTTTDKVEQIGVELARQALKNADLVLWVIDATTDKPSHSDLGLDNLQAPLLQVINKSDLSAGQRQPDYIYISALNAADDGKQLQPLCSAIAKKLGWQQANTAPWLARERHVKALERCQKFLQAAGDKFTSHSALELLAEDLRAGQLALDEITGDFSADDLLGKIFSEFCIGK